MININDTLEKYGDPMISAQKDPKNETLYVFVFDIQEYCGRRYARCYLGMSKDERMVADVHSNILPLLIDKNDPDVAHPIGMRDLDSTFLPDKEDEYIRSHPAPFYKKLN